MSKIAVEIDVHELMGRISDKDREKIMDEWIYCEFWEHHTLHGFLEKVRVSQRDIDHFIDQYKEKDLLYKRGKIALRALQLIKDCRAPKDPRPYEIANKALYQLDDLDTDCVDSIEEEWGISPYHDDEWPV